MVQQMMGQSSAYPKRREIFFHFIKTGKLVGALFTDRRVSILRKVLFIIVIAALLAVLVFPDTAAELGLSVVLPIIGTVLGVPIDAGFDWLAFSLLAVNLLHIFPKEIVADHYSTIF